MDINEIKLGQVFKDNDRSDRILYPFITILAYVDHNKVLVRRTKDVEGKVAPRDVKTKISIHRLISHKYSLVKGVSPVAELEPTPA